MYVAAAILGLVGVIVGFGLGQGYAFWATRRGELTAAVVAAATLAEDLRRLRDSSPPLGRSAIQRAVPVGNPEGELTSGPATPDRDRLSATWSSQRASLVPFMRPDDFMTLVGLF